MALPAEPPLDPAGPRLRRMRRLALGLLLAMAALFALAVVQSRSGSVAWGYVAAFAEAAMVGALADWFAVVALFRHPLGLPIWHTAIVPRRKDDIARNLGRFIETHVVSTATVLTHLRGLDPAGQAAGWLAQPAHAHQVAAWLATAVRPALARLDDGPLRERTWGQLQRVLLQIDPVPSAVHWGRDLVAEGRHQRALDALLTRAIEWLDSEAAQPALAAVLDSIDHVLISALSGRLAAVVRSGAVRLAQGALNDPDHLLRRHVDDWAAQALDHLAHDAGWAQRVHAFQHGVVQGPALRGHFDAAWARARQAVLDDLTAPDSRLVPQVAAVLAGLAASVRDDAAGIVRLNTALADLAEPVVAGSRGRVAAYVQAQVDAWSQAETTARIERAIGADLQAIRINGTVVGGLVGLALHALVQWLGR